MGTHRFQALLAALVALFATIAFAQTPAPPAWTPTKQYLVGGEMLATSQYLRSPNGQYIAIQQTDGNFCVYKGTPQQFERLLWCHYRTAPGGQYLTIMQTDGNLCTYRGTLAKFQAGATWCSNAVALGGQFVLVQQDDGNLCVYKGTPAQKAGAIWCHNTGMTQAAPPTPTPTPATPPAPPAGGSVTGGDSAILTVNGTNASMWVTVYHVFAPTPATEIVLSGCVRAGQTASWTVMMADRRSHRVRAEMTSTVDCSSLPGNRHVVCDTSADVDSFNSNYFYWLTTLKANANTCWWEGNGTQRKGSR